MARISMELVAQLYRRAFALARDWPWLLLVPAGAELLQHAAEIHGGMYSAGMDAGGRNMRLVLGALKAGAIVCTLIVAWRWWRFDEDMGRALRPTARLFKGVAAFIIIQVLGGAAALAVGLGLVSIVHVPTGAGQIALALAPDVLWLLASMALFPWYVGLATEDPAMTLRSALQASCRRLPGTWALFFAGFLPLMIAHYALGYAALQGAPAWPLMITDSLLVGLLTAALAATYYTIYLRAIEHGTPSQ